MKKILYISLLILLLTGCGSKEKEKNKPEKLEQEQVEKIIDDVYLVMSSIMVEYQISGSDSEPIELPFTVTCNEKEGCTYGAGKKMDLEVTPKSGTFVLKDETIIFETTSNIKMWDYS